MFAYFVQDIQSACIKIGKAVDVQKRLQSLQCGHPTELVLLGATSSYTESDLHERFDYCRQRGEWFYPSPNLIIFIRTLFPGVDILCRAEDLPDLAKWECESETEPVAQPRQSVLHGDPFNAALPSSDLSDAVMLMIRDGLTSRGLIKMLPDLIATLEGRMTDSELAVRHGFRLSKYGGSPKLWRILDEIKLRSNQSIADRLADRARARAEAKVFGDGASEQVAA